MALLSCSQKHSNNYLQLEMYGDHEAALYIVDNDGGVSFGGGLDALVGEVSWHGQLSDQQLTKLSSIITHWDLESQRQQLQHRFVIKLRDEQPIEVSLKNSNAIHLYENLQGMTSNRYSEILETLPRPTTKIIIDRSVEGERNKDATNQATHQSE